MCFADWAVSAVMKLSAILLLGLFVLYFLGQNQYKILVSVRSGKKLIHIKVRQW
jgi:hypothetical protein